MRQLYNMKCKNAPAALTSSSDMSTALSLMVFRLTSCVIRKIMHKIGFLGHPMGASGAMYALYLKFLAQRNLLAQFYRENVSFTRKTAN